MTRALNRAAPSALLLLAALLGHLIIPAGPLRALLVFPAVLWLPGRALVAALGLATDAARFTAPLCVALSLPTLIAAGLLSYAVFGHLASSVLPLWTSAALFPLNLLERTPPRPRRSRLPVTAWGVLLYGAGTAAAAGLLCLVWSVLPTAPPQPSYLAFALGRPYASVPGVLEVEPGQVLTVPTVVTASEHADLKGYSVAALVDGRPVSMTPVTPARTASLTVTTPTGCLHQIRLALMHADRQLRSVDLYVDAGGGSCGGR
ncbi:hypothetical protein ACFV2N_46385 [Streptomyces sp. NPDC059680]|uniref:hypothetical protein n=1 Tax=Streptomyces sp. NPDC059680 TaxID=3346904 RepID=UPI0036C62332